MRTTPVLVLLYTVIVLCSCKKSAAPVEIPTPIVSIDTDDDANIINWTKAPAGNFKAYEIYAIRTVELPDRGPAPDGALIATINDPDVTSFRHNDIMFYYKYRYIVKVVTLDEERIGSDPVVNESGNFIYIGGESVPRAFFNPATDRIYLNNGKLMVIDPTQPAYVDSIIIPEQVRWMTVNDANSKMNLVLVNDYNSYQAGSVDLNTKQVTLEETLSFPDGPKTILACIDKTVLYAGHVSSTPFIPVTMAYNIVTGEKKIIRWGYTGNAQVLTGNRVLVSSFGDSIFVFQYDAGDFILEKSYPVQGIFVNPYAHESSTLIALGTSLYDQSFNKVHEIDPGTGDSANFFTGISTDGKYVTTQRNEIINIETKQVERRYGDGFGGLVFFSSDNDVLYHFTANGFSARYRPHGRFHRYRWR